MLTKYIWFLGRCPFLNFLAVILCFSFMISLFNRLLVWNYILVAVRIAQPVLLFVDNALVEILVGVNNK